MKPKTERYIKNFEEKIKALIDEDKYLKIRKKKIKKKIFYYQKNIESCKKYSKMKQNTIMYIFVNKSLKMSKGKMAAQVAHGAVLAYRNSDREIRSI